MNIFDVTCDYLFHVIFPFLIGYLGGFLVIDLLLYLRKDNTSE